MGEPMESTVRSATWKPVEAGERVSLPCEGGWVGAPAPERGVSFEVDGQDGVYVPESLVDEVVAHLGKKPARRRR